MIYRPLKPFILNQGFGENRICYKPETKEVITCDGNNPPEGYQSIYGPEGHLGLDLRAWRGQEVRCALKGVVYKIDTDKRSGLDVRIQSGNIRHIYEHLLSYVPQVGDVVETGQVIGHADNTGWSSGDHLHFQVEELQDDVWTPIDPLSIMDDVYAKDILRIQNKVKYLAEQVAVLAERVANYLRRSTPPDERGHGQ